MTRRLPTLALLLVLVLTQSACTTGKRLSDSPADKPVADTTHTDQESDEIVSQGLAGAVGESAGWENTVSGKEAEEQPFTFTEQLLRGQVAGVEVIQHPGGGISVRIRGISSIMAGTEPLYIVDGMPVLQQNGKGLSWLNTQDIAKIEVIKDISAKALYGARGSNGVVIITTKLGEQENP